MLLDLQAYRRKKRPDAGNKVRPEKFSLPLRQVAEATLDYEFVVDASVSGEKRAEGQFDSRLSVLIDFSVTPSARRPYADDDLIVLGLL